MIEQPSEWRDTLEEREQSARHVLNAYRERRRRRRAEDTFSGSAALFLQEAEKNLSRGEIESRRSGLMQEAEEVGMSMELAELLYDIAREEGIDPAIGFDLVCSGLGVCPPEGGVSNAPDAPMVDKYLPSWMFPPLPTDRVLRERTLRVSFRRLRSLLETHDEIDQAFAAFAQEPDVGHCGY